VREIAAPPFIGLDDFEAYICHDYTPVNLSKALLLRMAPALRPSEMLKRGEAGDARSTAKMSMRVIAGLF
jgi:hypothetical protein